MMMITTQIELYINGTKTVQQVLYSLADINSVDVNSLSARAFITLQDKTTKQFNLIPIDPMPSYIVPTPNKIENQQKVGRKIIID